MDACTCTRIKMSVVACNSLGLKHQSGCHYRLISQEIRVSMADVDHDLPDLAQQPQSVDDEHKMPSPEEEEAAIRKKYGGLIPKKPPLISKDHERAYFDSADWALEKGEQPDQKPKPVVEGLRPKLQPTPHQPLPTRRASYENIETEDELKQEDSGSH
ncbi:hypothetical protein KP509_35G060700 [Ceratopteris richardii]|uniref:cAMP-regulated phosphoprotein 19-related protein n=1 Tax=Ceratopteris richardii TaxID=49495 RepID=A0A8T2QG63_CERRI|nr:hypothetical protein KP509_35G060700 [Ceratopteris richardii]